MSRSGSGRQEPSVDPSVEPSLGRAGWLIVLQIGTFVALSLIFAQTHVDGRLPLLAGGLFSPFIAWQMGKAAQARGRNAWLYGLASLVTPLAIPAHQQLHRRGWMLSKMPAAMQTHSGRLHLSWGRFCYALSWLVVPGSLLLWRAPPGSAAAKAGMGIGLVSCIIFMTLGWRRMRIAYAADPAITRGDLSRAIIGPVWLMITWTILTTILALTPLFLQVLPILR